MLLKIENSGEQDQETFLTLSEIIPGFYGPQKKKAFGNIVGKGEKAGNQHFLLLCCFLP